MIVSTS